MIYGEVETGAGYCVLVSSAEGFAGVDCCVLVLPTWDPSIGKRISQDTYKRKRLLAITRMFVSEAVAIPPIRNA
jgi:hypothetical protein